MANGPARGKPWGGPHSWLPTMILQSSLVAQVPFPGLVLKAFLCQGGKPRAKRLTPRVNPGRSTPGLAYARGKHQKQGLTSTGCLVLKAFSLPGINPKQKG